MRTTTVPAQVNHHATRFGSSGRAVLLGLALLALSACGTTAGGMFGGPLGKEIKQPMIQTVDFAALSYENQVQERKTLQGKAAERRLFPVEQVIGVLPDELLLGNRVPIVDPILDKEFRAIAERLLAGWAGPKPEYRFVFFYMAQYDQPIDVAAHADGTIAVSLGALRDLEFQEELEFFIAHELAHLLLNHFRRFDAEEHAKRINAVLTTVAILGDAAAHGQFDDQAQAADPKGGEISAYALLAGTTANFLITDVVSPSFSRQQEAEADLLAIDLLVKANRSPVPVENVMERLRSLEQKHKEAADALRKSQMEQRMQAERAKAEAQGQVMLFPPIPLGEIFAMGIQDLMDSLRRTHPSAVERTESSLTYMGRFYEAQTSDRSFLPASRAAYQGLLAKAKEGPLLRKQNAIEAIALMRDGKLEQAYSQARSALASPKDNSPFVQSVLYQIRKAQASKLQDGRKRTRMLDEALGHLQLAWSSPEAYDEIALALAEEYADRKRFADADGVLVEASRRAKRAERFYVPRLRYLFMAGDTTKAFEVYEVCTGSKVVELSTQCYAAVPESQRDALAAFLEKRKAERAQKA